MFGYVLTCLVYFRYTFRVFLLYSVVYILVDVLLNLACNHIVVDQIEKSNLEWCSDIVRIMFHFKLNGCLRSMVGRNQSHEIPVAFFLEK